MKSFIERNESFVCENCGITVTRHPTSSRDHCTACLYGKHVDYNAGDRLQTCHGLLEPIGLRVKNGKQQIVYSCNSCNEKRYNVVAIDDDIQRLTEISQLPWQ
ncbi:RNHCP domain-containing protein [bacterium]|nr:RNHCP domain-containing protein [bacterium]